MTEAFRWLDRRVGAAGPYLTLCLNESEFRQAMSHLKSKDIPRWVNHGSGATTHTFDHEKQGVVCIVCMQDYVNRDPIEIAGLLVHEAVHVWQNYCDTIGERDPGREQEAYAVQAISQELMAELRRRMGA